ncbi:hypothetical protein OG453_07015 [Streptomyces sp. NBC_01381]|uniref:hypothetical protein n=1 Tax=Streptomyces sp. NBC_01381 TaxID=2903845 RepID=UPI002252F21E|nr:hypothetical protein [Streptomyces sp. NBC_01381]MCX4666418.1 hypothetical protein [Streptomyces sp. NBC_01381]
MASSRFALRSAPATVIDRKGPWPDGSWEYQVRAACNFSRRPGPDNPESRTTWWPSWATTPSPTNEEPVNDNISNSESEDGEQEILSLHRLLARAITAVDNNMEEAFVVFGLPSLWSLTRPEVRRQVLLLAAWEARSATAAELESPSSAGQYAWAFTQYASSWAEQHPDGNANAFCAGPHSARHAASSLAFDRDDFLVSLETALLLCSRAAAPEES